MFRSPSHDFLVEKLNSIRRKQKMDRSLKPASSNACINETFRRCRRVLDDNFKTAMVLETFRKNKVPQWACRQIWRAREPDKPVEERVRQKNAGSIFSAPGQSVIDPKRRFTARELMGALEIPDSEIGNVQRDLQSMISIPGNSLFVVILQGDIYIACASQVASTVPISLSSAAFSNSRSSRKKSRKIPRSYFRERIVNSGGMLGGQHSEICKVVFRAPKYFGVFLKKRPYVNAQKIEPDGKNFIKVTMEVKINYNFI